MAAATAKSNNNEEIKEEADDESCSEMALRGVQMMLNNSFKESEALFRKYKNEKLLMSAGYSFVAFMNATMTFEEEDMNHAMESLKFTESQCMIEGGFLQLPKKKNGNSVDEKAIILEDKLQRHIVLADCQVCMALLTFINQDLSSYIRGGWILRKAWKIYEKTYKEIKHLYDKYCKRSQSTSPASTPTSPMDDNFKGLPGAPENHPEVKDGLIGNLPYMTVSRLMAGVSFGYGIFQLCISLLPPSLLRLIHFLGFEGDRDIGLAALLFARQSKDMKAPLATLGLLWYHTVVRPFFALDGSNTDAGVESAIQILDECQIDFPNSAIFSFFRGRVRRLQKDLDGALTSYNLAVENSSNQREIQLIALHEIGWCNLMSLNWLNAVTAFGRLVDESRWSKSYYAYMIGVSYGAAGKMVYAKTALKHVPDLVRHKNNQLEIFAKRRAERLLKEPYKQEHMTLLTMELLFLWNALPSCSPKVLQQMLLECDKDIEKKYLPLKCLIEGAIYVQLGNEEMALQCYKESVARSQGTKDDQHVAAFALFELGVVLSHDPKTASKGKALILQAKDTYKNYDFENRLSVKIHAALKKMK